MVEVEGPPPHERSPEVLAAAASVPVGRDPGGQTLSGERRPAAGSICRTDLTVSDADSLRESYRAVIGWNSSPVDMGGYHDHSMLSAARGGPVAGICNAGGLNADLPAQWLVYIAVEDVEASARECVARGGSLVSGPKEMDGGRFCVIRDPAGAVCALYHPST